MDRFSKELLLPSLRHQLEVARAESKKRTLVDKEEQIGPAVAKLRDAGRGEQPSPLAVDCEGQNLSRRGKLSLLAIGTEEHAFLFDVQTLGGSVVFRAGEDGLRDLLEDEDLQKIMFDCRQDADCLWHQYNVKLANVLDLQLLQVIYKERRERSNIQRRYGDFQPMLDGFGRCLELYVHDASMTMTKNTGQALLKRDKTVFMKRPLDAKLLAYAAVDIRGACALYRQLWAKANLSPAELGNLQEGCRRYLAFHRDKVSRTYDKYEVNPFVPWGVLDLPAYGHFPYSVLPDSQLIECSGCRCRLPRQIFTGRSAPCRLKCPVCRKVDARELSTGSRRF